MIKIGMLLPYEDNDLWTGGNRGLFDCRGHS